MTRSLMAPRALAVFTLLAVAPAWAQEDQPKKNTESPKKGKKKKAEPAKPVEAKPVEPAKPEDTYGPTLPPAPVEAEVVKPAPKKAGWGHLMAAARLGGLFAEPFSNLGASFLVGAEIGYLLPPLPVVGEGFGVTIDVAYTQPTASGAAMDARIGANGGNYKWDVTQRETILGLTLLYRAPFIMDGKLVPYIGFGPRIFMMQTSSGGEAGSGNSIPGYNENSTQAGLGLPLGADYKIGPGRVFLEALLLYAPLNTNTTGSSSAGSISVAAGYRFIL